MDGNDPLPFAKTWWIEPGKILGGPTPVHADIEQTKRMIASLIAGGVRVIVNLQEPNENTNDGVVLNEYASMIDGVVPSENGGIKLVRFPVPDGDTPTQEQMVAILGVIRDALLGGAMVYVHCLAGYGRTGTVAWSWLVSQGRTPTEAMETIAKNRAYDRELAAKESPGFLQQQELNRRFVARKEV